MEPKNKLYQKLLLARKAYHEKPAIIYNDQLIDYNILWEKLDERIELLKTLGIKPGHLVGLHFPKGLEQVYFTLALFALDATFAPIPFFKDSIQLLEFCEKQKFNFLLNDPQLLSIDDSKKNIDIVFSSIQCHKLQNNFHPQIKELAYICYTSGTTGQPKGVMISKAALLNTLCGMEEIFPLQIADKIFSISQPTFDLSIYDIFAPLTTGAALVLPTPEELTNPHCWLSICKKHNVTIWNSAPALFSLAVESNTNILCQNLRKIFLSGDWLPIKILQIAQKINPSCKVISLGGATEATIWSIYHHVSENDKQLPSIPYGIPLPKQSCILLDKMQQEIKPTSTKAGILYLGGKSVADGYWLQEKLSKEKFITHPAHGRLYKTDDRAKYLKNGELLLLGRSDNKIKIHGLWLDLQGIQQVILKLPEVETAHVFYSEKLNQIFAAIVSQEELTENELSEYLQNNEIAKTPSIKYIFLPSLPLTFHGKINTAALENLAKNLAVSIVAQTKDEEFTRVEKLILNIWQAVLNISLFSRDDDFFLVGGSSFKAFRLVGLINQAFGINISIKDIFTYPKFSSIAKIIESEISNSNPIFQPTQHFKSQHYKANPEQTRLLLLAQNTLPGCYNLPILLKVNGALNKEHLHHVIKDIVAQKSILRSYFANQNGQELIIADKIDNSNLLYISHEELDNIETLKEFILKPIDCFSAPLWRIIVWPSKDYWKILLVFHHALLDGYSVYMFAHELLEAYENTPLNQCVQSLRISEDSYKNFNTYTDAKKLNIDYWKSKLASLPILSLPTSFSRKKNQTFHGNSHIINLTQEQVATIKLAARNANVTIANYLLVHFLKYLSVVSAQQDIVIGVNFSDRNTLSDFNSYGFKMHTQLLRTQITSNEIEKFAREIQIQLLVDKEKYVPLYELLTHITFERREGFPSLFQILFSYLEVPKFEVNSKIEDIPISYPTSKLDLTLYVFEYHDDKIALNFEYATDLFSSNDIEIFANNFLQQMLIANSNDHFFVNPRLAAFWKNTKLHSDKIAITDAYTSLTYQNLGFAVKNTAEYLRKKGVASGSRVAINLPRNCGLVIALLAILECGAHFVPISSEWPKAYQKKILEEANPEWIITQKLAEENKNNIIPELEYTLYSYSENKLPKDSDLAYIIFTSGSTGDSKGVEISYSSLEHCFTELWERLKFSPLDRFAAITALSFDISLVELLLPIFNGASTFICSFPENKTPNKLIPWLIDVKASVIQTTPSFFNELLRAGWNNKENSKILCGGEAITPNILQGLLQISPSIWNLYGPTEATIWSSTALLSNPHYIHIGEPLKGVEYHIQTLNTGEVDNTEEGELLICGWNLAKGYLNNPELSHRQFINIPSLDKKAYKTGDLVRKYNGKYYYLGRIDRICKIRGNRISLPGIEDHLAKLPLISETAVINKNNEDLHAILVPKVEKMFSQTTLGIYYFGSSETYQSYDDYIQLTQYADQLNFDSVWVPERHFDSVGGLFANPAIIATALAAATKRIKIYAGSVVSPLHDTIRIAEDWAMINKLSAGRAGLALASGWHSRDFVLAPNVYKKRKEYLIEQIHELRKLWNAEPVKRLGGDQKEWLINTFPRLDKALPLFLSLASDRNMFREAAVLKTNILTHLLLQSDTELSDKISIFRGGLAAHEEDISQYTVTLMVHAFVHPNAIKIARNAFKEYLRQHVGLFSANSQNKDDLNKQQLLDYLDKQVDQFIRERTLIGTPKECWDRIQRWYSLGVNQIACLVDFGLPVEEIIKGMNNLAELNNLKIEYRPVANYAQYAQTYLQELIPQAWLPNRWEVRHVPLPLTLHGKIDYLALNKQITYAEEAKSNNFSKEAVLTPIQKELLSIWQTCLKRKDIPLDQHFYSVGGHSLLSMQVIHEIATKFNIGLNFLEFASAPTIIECARLIERKQAVKNSSPNNFLLKKYLSKDPIRATISQQQIWALQKFGGFNSELNDVVVYKITGDIDTKQLCFAINKLIKTMPSLGTIFEESDGQLWQVTHPTTPVHILNFEAENIPTAISIIQLEAKEIILSNILPLIKFILIKITPKKHVFSIVIHHLINDGWSMKELLKHLSQFYNNPDICEEQTWNMLDYSYSEASWLRDSDIKKTLAEWHHILKNQNKTLGWPYKTGKENFKGNRIYFSFNKELSVAIRHFSSEQKISVFECLFACYSLCIFDLISSSTFVCAVPFANREIPGTETIIGNLVNLLPIPLEKNKKFEEQLHYLQRILLLAKSTQFLPLPKILSYLAKESGWDNIPKVHIGFAWQNIPNMDLNLDQAKVVRLPWHSEVAYLDLLLIMEDFEECIQGYFAYNEWLFSKEQLTSWLNSYTTRLENLVKVETVNPISYQSKPETILSQGSNLYQRFSNQVAKQPNAIGLIDGNKHISYIEISGLCDQATAKMLQLQWQPGARILLLSTSHQYSIAFVLALWRINASVLWLDIESLPAKRLEQVLNDIQPYAIVYDAGANSDILNFNIPAININNFFDDKTVAIVRDLIVDTSLPAYMIYTSGTLGRPKCPVISQASLGYIIDQHQSYGWNKNAIVAQMASLQFDVSILEMWGTLLLGGTLVLIPYDLKLQPYLLEQRLLHCNIDTMVLATKVFQQYIESYPALFSELETVIFGGEKINLTTLNTYLTSETKKPKNLLQGYGLSETTIVNTIQRIHGPRLEKTLSLGTPLPGISVLLLDKDKNIIPPSISGKIGEIIISGPTRCLGFMIDGKLTQTLLSAFQNELCYETGDLCYWNTQEELVLVERKDRQVKINGKRVDLIEVETLIKQHPSVANVAVTEDSGKIHAYIKLASQAQNIWDDIYKWFYEEQTIGAITLPNFSGWNSAITRNPLPHEEMLQWLDDTVSLIHKLKPKRVLEIGVGSGNIANALSSQAESYVGIDMAEPIITWLEENFVPHHPNCKFLKGTADQLKTLNLQKMHYDVIILNSIVQYFQNIKYLNECLSQALEFLTTNGSLFIGDVRDPRLLELLEKEIQLAISPNYIYQSREEELLVHPGFFIDFAKKNNLLIGIYLKPGSFNNELSRYRYDVILSKTSQSWQTTITITGENLNISKLNSILNYETDLLIEDIRNARIEATHNENASFPSEIISKLNSLRFYAAAFVSPNPKHFNIVASKNESLFLQHPNNLRYFGDPVHYEPKSGSEVLLESIKKYCQQNAPEYMVPQYFIAVSKIPLTNNGKTDFDALKEIKPEKLNHKPEIKEDKLASQLCHIFSLLLNISELSIDDNLFDCGLDSISLIHAVAKAKEQNITLSPRLVMQHPTIRALTGCITNHENNTNSTTAVSLDSTTNKGLLLSPAQQFFFSLKLSQRNHWNLAIWVGVKKEIPFEFLKVAIRTVCEKHAGLQIRFKNDGKLWKPEKINQHLFSVEKMQFSHHLSENEFNKIANEVQAGLDIENGPLLRLLWVQDITGYYLLLVVHHLWVDSISLSLILNDLENAISCLEDNQKIKLMPIPTPLQTWLEQLQKSALKWEVALDYWKRYEHYSNTIPRDRSLLSDLQEDTIVHWSKLSKKVSDALLQAPLKRLGIPINAIFLAALGGAFYKIDSSLEYLLVNVDSHGRHTLPDDISLSKTELDLSRTIGWLTAVYPVKVNIMHGHLPECLNRMIEMLEELEQYRLSFGALSYMGKPEVQKTMAQLPKPKIGFNYFGKQFQNFSSESLFYSIPQNCGAYRGPQNIRLYEIEINGFYKDDHLEFRWEFNPNCHSLFQQRQLMSTFLNALEELSKIIVLFV